VESLLASYPGLAGFPFVDLGRRPTPVDEVTVDGLRVLVKRDDTIGGNKTRCLEFLLALPAKRLLTISSLSANHAWATAVRGKRIGLETDVIIVRWGERRLAMERLPEVAARVVETGGGVGGAFAALRLWRPGTRVIPPGGASARGALGYCNAVFELGEIPSRIYVPLGTGNTTSGLLAGLMLRGADCEVVAVRVTGAVAGWQWRIWRRAFAAVRLLRKFDPSIPAVERGKVRLRVVVAKGEYGERTPESVAAVEAAGRAGLVMETTYTGKALAVLLDERAKGAMFIHTFAPPQP
jgi:D-cysteine desulfhydrase